MRELPRIHLSDYYSDDPAKKQKLIQTLGDGLCEFGFVKVADHGVDPDLYAKAYDQFRSFFAFEQSIKDKYSGTEDSARGYTPFGKEHAKDNPHPDLKEFWQVGQQIPEGDPEFDLFYKNIWPSEIPDMQQTVVGLYESLEACAVVLFEAFALYFGLPVDTFSKMIHRGDSVLRAIHYPPVEGEIAPNQVRAAAHEDINMMTLLPKSEGAGLELLTHEGEWLALNATKGDLIVDTGDMMSRVTNNHVPATTHRVVNPNPEENNARYSMPFFIHAHPHCDLSVLDHFTSEDNPAKFPPITAREFLQQRLVEIGRRK
jgi:isopenicillin N synthase-like dioxygenase